MPQIHHIELNIPSMRLRKFLPDHKGMKVIKFEKILVCLLYRGSVRRKIHVNFSLNIILQKMLFYEVYTLYGYIVLSPFVYLRKYT
jgi:hypothetical protein